MVLAAIGLVLLGVMLGGAGLRRAGRLTRRMVGPWRPGVGVGALVCLFGGAALAARGAVIEGLAVGGVGLLLAVGARMRPGRRATSPEQDASGSGSPSGPSPVGMSAQEARSLLGVGPEADLAAVEAAYRRLMLRVHPDRGGASGLAAQLNAARAVLVK